MIEGTKKEHPPLVECTYEDTLPEGTGAVDLLINPTLWEAIRLVAKCDGCSTMTVIEVGLLTLVNDYLRGDHATASIGGTA